jgi:hypothetical protein
MKLINTNPQGDIDLPLIGRAIAAGEEFEVSDEIGAALLLQEGNYAEAKTTKPAKAATTTEESN